MLSKWTDHARQRSRLILFSLAGLSITLLVLGSSIAPNTAVSPYIRSAIHTNQKSKIEDERNVIEMPELRKLCNATTWQPGLYHVCDDGNGGIGNMMSFMLACTRYSIEAGAAMTLPKIEHRGENLADLTTGNRVPFSYLFQEKWYVENLAYNCPQLEVMRDIGEVMNFADARIPEKMEPSKLRYTSDSDTINLNTATFKTDIMNWLGEQELTPASFSLRNPIIFRTALKAFEWSAHSDGELAWVEFGKLLRWREDIRELAAQVLQVLHNDYSETKAGFLGAHLRTEADVKDVAVWIGYDDQRDYFLQATKNRGMSMIYVASGSTSDIQRLTDDASREGLTVLTKTNLLDSHGLTKLASLSWDQQAMVDYLVLRNSAFFVGFAPSSFTFALAYARQLDDIVASSDTESTSQVVGHTNSLFYEHGMWPSSEKVDP